MRRKLSKPAEADNAKVQEQGHAPLLEKFIRFCESDFGKQAMDLEAAYLRRELSGCARILDVGCGIGSIEQRLPELNVTGLDSSEEMLIEARKRSDKTFVKGESSSLPFANGFFDAVFMVTTLEFLTDYKKALDEAARILTNRGRLVVLMLNPDSGYFKAHYAKEGDYFRNIKHSGYAGIATYASALFYTSMEYFLGVDGENVSVQGDRNSAALFVIKGRKR